MRATLLSCLVIAFTLAGCAGAQVEPDSSIRLLGEDLRFVGRGGLKLERALHHWSIDATGRDIILEVDGGVNAKTAPRVIAAGATALVAAERHPLKP